MRRWPWLLAALVPMLALLAWVVQGESGPQTLTMPRGFHVSTSAVMTVVATLITMSFVVAAFNPRFGLVLFAIVMLGTAVFWPAVQDNEFSGDIVITLGGKHGIHENDWYALGPATLAALALVIAWKLEPRRPVAQ